MKELDTRAPFFVLGQEYAMDAIADICLIPIGVGVSVSKYVAVCQDIFDAHGLTHTMHAYGTTVEGSWDEVFAAIKDCHAAVHEAGAPRISSTIKVGTRTDREQTGQDKIQSVQKLRRAPED